MSSGYDPMDAFSEKTVLKQNPPVIGQRQALVTTPVGLPPRSSAVSSPATS
jgi:hypothetical protein